MTTAWLIARAVGAHRHRDCPAGDLGGVDIGDERGAPESLPGPHEGDIGNPQTIRRRGLELAVDQISRSLDIPGFGAARWTTVYCVGHEPEPMHCRGARRRIEFPPSGHNAVAQLRVDARKLETLLQVTRRRYRAGRTPAHLSMGERAAAWPAASCVESCL